MAAGPRFFMSYARNDRAAGDEIARFYRDLSGVLRQRLGIGRDEEPGFFDSEGIEPGTEWPDVLGEALRTTSAFVPILSPSYFSSVYCGKEWAAFAGRLPGNPKDIKAPGLIQPVLLVPPQDLRPIPTAVRAVQYDHERYPPDYRTRGLSYLSAVPSEADAYQIFVNEFADKLVRALRNNELPPAGQISPLAEINSAFHEELTQVQRVESGGPPGRRLFAQFVFVAAQAQELGQLRRELSAYGELGGLDWQPYLPPLDAEVDMIVNEVALREGYRYESVQVLDRGLVAQIRKAVVDQRKVVVVVVDAWTVMLEPYQRLMQELDGYSLPSCVVIVPVNRADAETASSEEALRAKVQQTFVNRHLIPDPEMFVAWVDSREALETGLARALGAAKMRIIKRYEVTRRAGSDPAPARMPLVAGPDRSIF